MIIYLIKVKTNNYVKFNIIIKHNDNIVNALVEFTIIIMQNNEEWEENNSSHLKLITFRKLVRL